MRDSAISTRDRRRVSASPEEARLVTYNERYVRQRICERPNVRALLNPLVTNQAPTRRCVPTTISSPQRANCYQDLNIQPESYDSTPSGRTGCNKNEKKRKKTLEMSIVSTQQHCAMKTNDITRWIGLMATTSALFVLYYCLLMPLPVYCQRGQSFQDLSGHRFGGNLSPQDGSAVDQQSGSSMPQSTLNPASSATFNQLLNILQSYAPQNGQMGGSRGRLPLGLVPRGLQQPQQISTPIQLQQQQQQQSNGRRPITFPGQPPVQMISSSPSTPFLQLNRIAGAPSGAQNQLVPNGRPPLGGQPMQQLSNQQLQPWLRQPQQQQVQRVFTQSQGNNPNRAIQPIPVLMPRPQAGFAPSGPPPSSGVNQAMVVVQSPVATSNKSLDQYGSPKLNTTTISTTTTSTTSETPILESTTSDQPLSSSSTTSSQPVNEIEVSSSNKNSTTTEPTNWNPVDNATTQFSGGNSSTSTDNSTANRNRINLVPSPDIVTVPPGYNPDAPPREQQTYDIPVTAQIGPNNKFNLITTNLPATNEVYSSSATSSIPSIAPTAVTTIIWTPPASETTELMGSSSQQHSTGSAHATGHSMTTQAAILSMTSTVSSRLREIYPTLVSSNSDLGPSKVSNTSVGVVYGKPEAHDSKPVAPADSLAAGQPFVQPVQLNNQVRPFAGGQIPPVKSQHSPIAGRPSRPLNSMSANSGGAGLQLASGFQISNHHATTNHTLGDIQDYLSAQPPLVLPSVGAGGGGSSHVENTISAHGGLDPANFGDLLSSAANTASHRSAINSNGLPAASFGSQASTSTGPPPAAAPEPKEPSAQQAPVPRLRRPTFKPRPAVPPIRIDSCIVDDDSSCDPDNNERCVTEYGISSCHCKPGYARLSQLRGFCSPIDAFQLHLKIDRLSDDRKLAYNYTLADPNSEEYQYLEFEAQQALTGAFQQSPAVKHLFMGARINKFYERKGKVWANISLHLGSNNDTISADKIQNQVTQELVSRLTGPSAKSAANQRSLGDSTILLDGSRESVSRLTDVNECSSRDLNDCSKFATCSNDLGTFHCQCMPGYEDKHTGGDPRKQGRVCLGCSPSYCSNRGECSIIDGERSCKCRPNFIGARCDIDTEVLAVAVGGSFIGLIILLGTFWCLFVFNRRWRREQQKLDAMSATSGLTYNYVNSASTNSLMSPARNAVGGLHRSGGHHQVGNTAAAYGQRIGAALVGSGAQHYAADQQAIIGSTSSGSSAASHQQLCATSSSYAPAHTAYQQQHQHYEDGGLLIAPASTSSSQQTSPTSNSYHNLHVAQQQLIPGSAYTLSGHHYQHHPQHHHHHQMKPQTQLSQFHAAPNGADYRTLTGVNSIQQYDARWRTLQQEHAKQSGSLGYYLSPDMLVGGQQQVYASPQRELCIDTATGNHNKSRRQQGRSGGAALRPRSHGTHNTLYYNQSDYN